jgi:hypothetical protein
MRRVLEIPMQWVLHKGKGNLANAVRSYESFAGIQNPNGQYLLPHARLCLGLFEAAEALGIGFVRKRLAVQLRTRQCARATKIGGTLRVGRLGLGAFDLGLRLSS